MSKSSLCLKVYVVWREHEIQMQLASFVFLPLDKDGYVAIPNSFEEAKQENIERELVGTRV